MSSYYDPILGEWRERDDAAGSGGGGVGMVEVVSGGSVGYIPILSGGMCYRFTDPLAAFAVDSVTKSIRESYIRFTLASGGSVSLPAADIDYLGEAPSFAGGKSYLLGFFNGIMATSEVV